MKINRTYQKQVTNPNLYKLALSLANIITDFPSNKIINNISIVEFWNDFQLLAFFKLKAYPTNKNMGGESTLIYPHQFDNEEELVELVKARLSILTEIISAKIIRQEAEKRQLNLF